MVRLGGGASGMAIISTNVAAIPEIVRNGETDLTVQVGDAVSMTWALRGLAVLGERAIAQVSHHYDAKTNASRLLDLKAKANAVRAQDPPPSGRSRITGVRWAIGGRATRPAG